MQSPTALADTDSIASQTPAPTGASAASEVATDAAIVQRHVRGVYQFARAAGADRDLAADLTQEAFAIAWQRGKSTLPEQALASFLRRTTRFLWLQHCRGEQRREAAIAAKTEQLWQQDETGIRDARIHTTRDCVQQLNGRAQQAVQLCYRDNLSREQIAEALEMTPNGVKTLLARTRRWLQQCIQRNKS
tara:strand:+ start:15985 stop:16554 length:570 start_codon:yes stop_codon:yes gene_type:complete